jgi:predicted unusual protein kinase regulating ubiquinone biosynthesis (AarF/ABC1/UbiB family)
MVMPGSDKPLPQGRIRRTMPLAGFAARAAGGRIVAGLREKAGQAGAVNRFHERTADQYAELLGHSKGVLMKAGQMFSMIDPAAVGYGELLPYKRALTRLQADAPPMEYQLVREILEADLGRSAIELFAKFNETPMAAASIGQVHRAVLRDGREVAVKIQYPGVAEAIRDDLANTELLTTFYRFAAATSGTVVPDIRAAAAEIASRIAEEIDYRHEAANIAAFAELYHGHPFIHVPAVVHEASGGRVLTMTYLDGMNWAAAQQADQDLKNTWAEVIWRFILSSYKHSNMFFADPHPGNYRFRPDGQVGFVDFGSVKVIPESQRRNANGLDRAAIDGRKHDVRDILVQIGMFAEDSTITVDEAYAWYSQIVHEWLAPQPFTFLPDTALRAIHSMVDARSPDHVLRRITIPEHLVFLTRINFSVNAVCAALGATVHIRALVNDLDGVAAPITDLGRQHVSWARERSLPFGMDPQ